MPTSTPLAHDAFHARAKSQPNHVAIELDHEWLSYGQLEALANTLASQLVHAHGVAPGDCVAVLMHRCLEVPIALLAAMQIGASILPLEGRLAQLDTLLAGSHVLLASEPYRKPIRAMGISMPVEFVDVQTLASKPEPFEPSFAPREASECAYILPDSFERVSHAQLLAASFDDPVGGLDRFHAHLWPTLARGHIVDLDHKQTPIASVREISCVRPTSHSESHCVAVLESAPPLMFMLPSVDLNPL
ncbi:Aste57867_15846 [Aphanomyces stellatus]|uniref:Aste57867_15846 protein n=1 Tax=Aphanomyces stellatus TaxID=120398 RepID=A0A485L411_9STRA|nr:hypothetical protein As57867_015790 [Aphanomyces stellatus]VFT92633.1 Aste57867_15846 [Aphanomyces stellatus]